MNRVILYGRIGHDPELRMSQGGKASLRLRIATSEQIKRGDEWVEATEWHNTIVWGKRAEALAKVLTKGARVLIEGKLRTREYSASDGNKRYTTEITIEHLDFGSDKRGAKPGRRTPSDDVDDIPF